MKNPKTNRVDFELKLRLQNISGIHILEVLITLVGIALHLAVLIGH